MKRLFMVGNTHFDPVWLWKWDEAMASIRSTFRSALDRMDEDPDFIYSFSTPPVFEWIRNTDPAMFEEIRKRVLEGRWELAEGWWVQPDCYSASGESYVRQGLYGQKYMLETFGRYAQSVFNVDSFGHSPQLPQILRKSRISGYCFIRPEKNHLTLEHPLFSWQGADGTTIPVFRVSGAYQKNLADMLDKQEAEDGDLLLVYGITNHGGAPTKEMLRQIHGEENAHFSSVSDYFKTHQTCGYTVKGELLTGDFGPYSNHPDIKKRNRIGEMAAQNAEAAALLAGNYDRKTLELCWRDILFNQFHDILGGACIREAYTDAENMLGHAIHNANEMTHFNLQSLTRQIKTVGKKPQDIWNLCLWNLNGNDFSGYVEAEVQWVHEFDWYEKGIALEDAYGNRYPCQVIAAKAVIPGFRSRFVFHAQVPSGGYRMFKVVQTGEEESKKQMDLRCVETEKLKICFNDSGTIEEICDRTTGKQLCGSIAVPTCYYDDGDTWCFNVERYEQERNTFALTESKIIEAGNIRTIVKNAFRFRESKLELYYIFYEKERYLDIRYRVNWNEKHYVLKLECSCENEHTASVPYGSVKRGETAADVPVGPWLASGEIAFLTDGIFSYNMLDGVLGLTVLRSPIYGDLRIRDIDYEDDYDILSQGIQEGRIRVSFDGGGFREAQSFLNPPVVVCEANHDGVLPSENSMWGLTGESVILSVVKKCEYDDSVILRMTEYLGKQCDAELRYGDWTQKITMAPYEIKTLKFDGQKAESVYMTEDGIQECALL